MNYTKCVGVSGNIEVDESCNGDKGEDLLEFCFHARLCSYSLDHPDALKQCHKTSLYLQIQLFVSH